jgi:glycosyltransferase involved in cell wall biosynthesis
VATHVVELLQRPDAAREIGANARRYVTAHHDWSLLCGRLVDVYRTAVSARRPRESVAG